MKTIIILSLLFVTTLGFSQVDYNSEITNKGKFFFYWGWNRGYYTDSDIRFKGDNYDFTLKNVEASDRPTPFSFNKYLNPANITIPQTDYRIGYFFKENYTISLGVDHMKYVVNQNQTVTINGKIGAGYGVHSGTYTGNATKQLTEDFLKFEHTDGLNYINVEVSRFDNISSFFKLNSKNFQINLTEGLGIGMLFPRTNTTLLGKERHDDFHVSGYGVSARAGLDFTFFKYFFIMSELKTGYINMPSVRTTLSKADSASQSFLYLQPTIIFGGRFHLFK